MNHPSLPADKIHVWDLNVPNLNSELSDASAAAIIANALYELKHYSANKRKYNAFADKIMKNHKQHYRSPLGTAKAYILLHSTGHKPANGEVDVPIIYADYYYLAAILRRGRK